MRQPIDELPVAMDQPGFKLLTPGSWGGMVVEYCECAERLDVSPMFKGLAGDRCPCPHWGYMLRGAFHAQYADGSEEVVKEGDVYYMPEAHTGWFEPGSAMILISPEREAKIVQEHIAATLAD